VVPALQVLPSHGWTQGKFGRRDRCLLVLSQLARVPYKNLAQLTVGRVTAAGGAATIASSAAAISVTAAANPVVCGPCAITRWLRVLDTVMTKPSHRVLARQIRDADPITDQSPHLCRSTRELSSLIVDVPLLPSIDQWGYVPFPLRRLTPHSLSRLVHQMLTAIASRTDGSRSTMKHRNRNSRCPFRLRQGGCTAGKTRNGHWARRHADLHDIAGIDDVLAEIDARTMELDQRTAALLAQNPNEPHQRNP